MKYENSYGLLFQNKVVELIKNVSNTQVENINRAALAIKNAILKEGVFHAFSTGHSHMVVEELFYRAGGIVPFNPIFDPATMLHEGAVKSTRIERLTGYAETIFKGIETRPGEPILITSNSGINAVPIEMAMLAKEREMIVIAITSISISMQQGCRHESGKRLMDIADIVIDNCLEEGDAVIEISEKTNQRIGALSTIIGLYIAQRIILDVVELLLVEEEVIPPIFNSANIPGGDEHNQILINKYKDRIKALR